MARTMMPVSMVSSIRRWFLVLMMGCLLLRPIDGRRALVGGGGGGGSTLEVVHKKHPDSLGMLFQDDIRVRRLQSNNAGSNLTRSAVTIPTSPGNSVGSGNFLVTVELGTPGKKFQLMMDTGSDVTWTQCRPCVMSCYNQTDPIFEPSKSSTYANVSCSSSICTTIFPDPRNPPTCTGQTCDYSITYGDNSSSAGWFATETLTLSSTVSIPNYIFGCGQDNKGFIGMADGLLGLSNNQISMVSQTASRFGRYFSYCLPSSSTSKGFLTFGNTTKSGGNSATLGYTTLVSVPQSSSFYGIKIIGISVGGTPLTLSSSKILMNSSAIIDSGTVISRLPPTVYDVLRSAVRKSLANYATAPAVSLFDTCYDFSKVQTIPDPKIIISFSGGVSVNLDTSGIFVGVSASQVCLAFAPNSADSDLVIYGNTQQMTFEIVYDVAGGKLGFSPGGCS